ncbi:DUF6708 domain-containing protein [Halomonas sp. V046]|uniref:DUF6708 domain-containing protein n=1 Tax=Halomonas sp. V046 TaxID=3459611 RepID=UPI0040442AEB
MDFTGLNRFTAYKVGRPITDAEKKGWLNQKESASDDLIDWLSVIKINSSYVEVVDRWYCIRGFSAWMGGVIGIPPLVFSLLFLFSSFKEEGVMLVTGVLFSLVLFLFSLVGWWLMRHDILRLTHYPVRLNRKTRKVYVFRHDGSVFCVDWDRLFIFLVPDSSSVFNSSDIRAHVLGEDGQTVTDTFAIGYPFLGDDAGAMKLWEYIRRYMEDPEGVKICSDIAEICMPIDGRREGVRFGLIRTFSSMVKWPFFGQFLFSPIWSMTTIGRWVAMYTSKVPHWPEEIEAACPIDPDDPYQKDWRDNGKYDFWEFGWPLICFFVGLGVLGVGLTFMVRELLA